MSSDEENDCSEHPCEICGIDSEGLYREYKEKHSGISPILWIMPCKRCDRHICINCYKNEEKHTCPRPTRQEIEAKRVETLDELFQKARKTMNKNNRHNRHHRSNM